MMKPYRGDKRVDQGSTKTMTVCVIDIIQGIFCDEPSVKAVSQRRNPTLVDVALNVLVDGNY